MNAKLNDSKLDLGKLIFIETEEFEVKILKAAPCKMSALSTKNDGWEYQVKTRDGRKFWICQDTICDE